MARVMARASTDKAIAYGQESLRIAKQENNIRWAEKAHSVLGSVYFMMSWNSLSLEEYIVALKLQTDLGLPEEMIKTQLTIAALYVRSGEIDRGRKELENGLVHFSKMVDTTTNESKKKSFSLLRGNIYTSIGTTHYKQNNYTKAIEFYIKALEVFEGRDTWNERAVLGGLGRCYQDLKFYDQAIKYFTRQLQSAIPANDFGSQLVANVGLGNAYLQTNDLSKSRYHFKSALDLKDKAFDLQIFSDAYTGLTKVFEKQRNFEEALSANRMSYHLQDSLRKKGEFTRFEELKHKYES
jgi:tetratricopeptide (TPR) repeat protein